MSACVKACVGLDGELRSGCKMSPAQLPKFFELVRPSITDNATTVHMDAVFKRASILLNTKTHVYYRNCQACLGNLRTSRTKANISTGSTKPGTRRLRPAMRLMRVRSRTRTRSRKMSLLAQQGQKAFQGLNQGPSHHARSASSTSWPV